MMITDPETGEQVWAPPMVRKPLPTSSYLYACEFPEVAPAVVPPAPVIVAHKRRGHPLLLAAGLFIGLLLLVDRLGMLVMYG